MANIAWLPRDFELSQKLKRARVEAEIAQLPPEEPPEDIPWWQRLFNRPWRESGRLSGNVIPQPTYEIAKAMMRLEQDFPMETPLDTFLSGGDPEYLRRMREARAQRAKTAPERLARLEEAEKSTFAPEGSTLAQIERNVAGLADIAGFIPGGGGIAGLAKKAKKLPKGIKPSVLAKAVPEAPAKPIAPKAEVPPLPKTLEEYNRSPYWKAKQSEYTERMKPYAEEAERQIKTANEKFMAGERTLLQNDADLKAINATLDAKADIVRKEMGFPTAAGAEVPPIPPEKPAAMGAGEIPPTKPPETAGAVTEDPLDKIIKAIDDMSSASREARLKYMTPDLSRKVKVLREKLNQALAEGNIEKAEASKSALEGALDIGEYTPKIANYSEADRLFYTQKILEADLKTLETLNATTALRKLVNPKVVKGKVIERLVPSEKKLLDRIFYKVTEPIGSPGMKDFPSPFAKQAPLGIEEPLLAETKTPFVLEKAITGMEGIKEARTQEQIILDMAKLNPSQPMSPMKDVPAGKVKTVGQVIRDKEGNVLASQSLPYQGLNVKGMDLLSSLPHARGKLFMENLKKIGLNIIDFFGIPKTMKFAFDTSLMGRQFHKVGSRHPIAWAKTWKPYLQAMKSEEVTLKLDHLRRTDPEVMEVVTNMKLDRFMVDIKRGAKYWDRPESVASLWAEKHIPGIRASNRGGAVAFNYILTEVAKPAYRTLKKMGAGADEMEAMGALFGELLGRGEMPSILRGTLGDVANKMLSSPRYFWSNVKWPTKMFSPYKSVRQEFWSTLVAWAGINATIMGLAKLSGVAEIEGDPRSSDQMKMRIGNKRFDMWEGWAQIIRLAANMMPYVPAKYEKAFLNSPSPQTALAVLKNADYTKGSRKTADGKIIPVNRQDLINRYLQSKESPGIGALITLATWQNYVGEKIDFRTLGGWGTFFKESFAPAALEEIGDAYFIEGWASSILSTLGIGGASISTYAGKPKKGSPEDIQKRLADAFKRLGR